MWPSRQPIAKRIEASLIDHGLNVRPLPGAAADDARKALVMQIVASLRRLDYTKALSQRIHNSDRANPESDLFDPERAAMLHERNGDSDEAVWLIFLSIHFGKHGRWGWKRLRDVYSGLGEGRWTWGRVSSDVTAFRDWLERRNPEIGGAFGNHRKYESLGAYNDAGTGNVVASYVAWVGPNHSHRERFAQLVREGGNDARSIFQKFYESFDVARFGRLGRFDFLAMLGRLKLAPIEPGSAFLSNATGPLRGARLLFGGNVAAPISGKTLDAYLIELDESLNVGMQVLEDSICNWQKSPKRFIHFKG